MQMGIPKDLQAVVEDPQGQATPDLMMFDQSGPPNSSSLAMTHN